MKTANDRPIYSSTTPLVLSPMHASENDSAIKKSAAHRTITAATNPTSTPIPTPTNPSIGFTGTFWQQMYCSFRAAFNGLHFLLWHERNIRVHAQVTLIVVVLAWLWQVTLVEAALLALVIGGVWVAEAFNTALEKLADALCPQLHPGIGLAKDIAAAAVLLMAATAVVVGILILGPKLWIWFGQLLR